MCVCVSFLNLFHFLPRVSMRRWRQKRKKKCHKQKRASALAYFFASPYTYQDIQIIYSSFFFPSFISIFQCCHCLLFSGVCVRVREDKERGRERGRENFIPCFPLQEESTCQCQAMWEKNKEKRRRRNRRSDAHTQQKKGGVHPIYDKRQMK